MPQTHDAKSHVGASLKGRRVFVTGHTGFVGGWICAALNALGAEVAGYALPAPEGRALFRDLDLANRMTSIEADIRDTDRIATEIQTFNPDTLFHLAAQPIVREAYKNPIETFDVNVMGTAKVLEAARGCSNLASMIVMTTDKVYRNEEWVWGYRETDALGGSEPYAASKSACEQVVDAYYKSYFKPEGIAVAAMRAGNIIGGGDWADARLIPDAVRAFETGAPLVLRNPTAVRPWQHVIDVVVAFFLLSDALNGNDPTFHGGWNIAPDLEDQKPVGQVATDFASAWGPEAQVKIEKDDSIPETSILRLDSTKARSQLGWKPVWSLDTALIETATWYKHAVSGSNMSDLTDHTIRSAVAL